MSQNRSCLHVGTNICKVYFQLHFYNAAIRDNCADEVTFTSLEFNHSIVIVIVKVNVLNESFFLDEFLVLP